MTTETIREALAELVAVEQLKKSLAQANHHAVLYPTDENYAVIDQLSADIARRRPLAWVAAERALAQQPQAAGGEQWRPMDTVPLDGTLVRLLVRFDNHAIGPAATEADGEWNFVGWDWYRDEYTRGSGDLFGWLPLVADAPAQQGQPAWRKCEFCGCNTNARVRACCEKGKATDTQPATSTEQSPTMNDALAAGDGTLHGAINHWQERALRAAAEREASLWREHYPAWCESLNRRAAVEQWMFDAARGKRPMPTPEELRDWAVTLGVPGSLREVTAAERVALTNAAGDVLAERRRQVEAEGWTPALSLFRQQAQEVGEAMAELQAKLEAAEQQVQEMREDHAKLQGFADAVMGQFPDHGDLDGFTLQEMAEHWGLLKRETITAPCGEFCACADAGVDGETECYRVQPVLSRARSDSAKRRAAIDAARKG